ncbi:MAG: M48 family metallopeptidase [Myxococcota bacterium]
MDQRRRTGYVSRWLTVLLTVGALAAPAGLVGCATTTGKTGKATKAATNVLLPPSQEVKLGRELARDVNKELTFHSNDEVQDYVRNLGDQIAKRADTPDPIRYTFRVVDDDEQINAFAMPGGYIYIYSGLIKAADNEAELAAVMSHEIAHVSERHVAERLVAAYGLQALTDAALGENPGLIKQLVASVGTQGFLLKYSRDHEREADAVGFDYLVKTGYDPMGFVTFFEKISGGARMPEFMSSHPAPGNRIDAARERIRELDNVPQKTNVEAIEAIQAKL